MTYAIWITTAVTFLVLLAYSVEQLCETYSFEIERRQQELDELDALCPQYR